MWVLTLVAIPRNTQEPCWNSWSDTSSANVQMFDSCFKRLQVPSDKPKRPVWMETITAQQELRVASMTRDSFWALCDVTWGPIHLKEHILAHALWKVGCREQWDVFPVQCVRNCLSHGQNAVMFTGFPSHGPTQWLHLSKELKAALSAPLRFITTLIWSKCWCPRNDSLPFLRGTAVIYRGDLPTSLHVCKSCFSSRVAAQ